MHCKALLTSLLATSLSACGPGGCPEDFHRACARAGCAPQVKEGVAKDASLLTKPDGSGNFPLNLAADPDIAIALLDAGADINAADGSSLTPMLSAIKHDRGDVLALLISRGATPRYNDYGFVLRDAAQKGKAKALKALLDSGAPVDAADGSTKATPLHLAVLNDHLEAAQILLTAGADPNAALSSKVQSGTSPSGSYYDMSVEKNVGEETPLKLARSSAMKELLKKKGAQ